MKNTYQLVEKYNFRSKSKKVLGKKRPYTYDLGNGRQKATQYRNDTLVPVQSGVSIIQSALEHYT